MSYTITIAGHIPILSRLYSYKILYDRLHSYICEGQVPILHGLQYIICLPDRLHSYSNERSDTYFPAVIYSY